MRRILITGSNRGIGLELVERYLQLDDTFIFATCRHPSQATALNSLASQYPERLKIIQLDVTDQHSIDEAVRQIKVAADGLEMLVNNAGILPGGVAGYEKNSATLGYLQADAIEAIFRVNTVAPMMIAQAFSDLLRKGANARLINVTSDAGSIEMTKQSAYHYSYKASKAALNMITRCLATDFRADGVIVISIHPGWIQTDMGGPHATLTPAETIPTMMNVIDDLTMDDSGSFLNWDGKPVPW